MPDERSPVDSFIFTAKGGPLMTGAYTTHPLADGCPPPWASGWGQDRYGVWVEFIVDEVTQRMRWIVPGRFMMGSPEDELERDEEEGPQHEVRLTQGFWMFDTPCTQILWETVMGENPSRFISPERPVEQVSWKDCQEFIAKINSMVPGLDLSLPTEAQWEYACRAGTTTATYAGDLEILGERSAPILDQIAWYGGNSGRDFDLAHGHDSSDWPEKQYDHKKAGTRIVRQKDSNPWGLYDMLGNVLEWCLDGERKYESQTETNPKGSMDESADRVLRGGSWNYYARLVRSAYRNARLPASRNVIIGFRCLRVQQEQAG